MDSYFTKAFEQISVIIVYVNIWRRLYVCVCTCVYMPSVNDYLTARCASKVRVRVRVRNSITANERKACETRQRYTRRSHSPPPLVGQEP